MEPKKNTRIWIQWGLVSLLVIVIAILSGVLLKMTRELEAISPAVVSALGKTTMQTSSSGHTDVAPVTNAAPRDASPPAAGDDTHLDSFNSDTWNPFAEMQRMQADIEHMFDDAFGRFSRSSDYNRLVGEPGFSPNLDIREQKDAFVLRLDLPGVKSGNVDVQVDGRKVTISGDRNNELTEKDASGNIVRRERSTGHFSRTVLLPEPVNPKKMQTDANDGVFTIIIPKTSA